MGMFDYVEYEGKEYQTKDTPDQWLSTYRIVGGRLVGDRWHIEDVPKERRPHPNDDGIMGLAGSIRRVIDEANVDLNWHGYIWLTKTEPDGNGGYKLREFRAKFTDGTLVDFSEMGE